MIIDGTIQYFNAEPHVQRHVDTNRSQSQQCDGNDNPVLQRPEFVEFSNNRVGFPRLADGGGRRQSIPIKPTFGQRNTTACRSLRITTVTRLPVSIPATRDPAYSSRTNGELQYNLQLHWGLFPITGFSDSMYIQPAFPPLPISIRSFTGSRQLGGHVLNWQVNCNSNGGEYGVLKNWRWPAVYTGT